MANHSYEPLPPGWGALSMLRPSRRRSRRTPWLLLLIGGAFVLALIGALAARA